MFIKQTYKARALLATLKRILFRFEKNSENLVPVLKKRNKAKKSKH